MNLENVAAGEIVQIETHITLFGPRAQVADRCVSIFNQMMLSGRHQKAVPKFDRRLLLAFLGVPRPFILRCEPLCGFHSALSCGAVRLRRHARAVKFAVLGLRLRKPWLMVCDRLNKLAIHRE
jgi:hypothetical protein